MGVGRMYGETVVGAVVAMVGPRGVAEEDVPSGSATGREGLLASLDLQKAPGWRETGLSAPCSVSSFCSMAFLISMRGEGLVEPASCTDTWSTGADAIAR